MAFSISDIYDQENTTEPLRWGKNAVIDGVFSTNQGRVVIAGIESTVVSWDEAQIVFVPVKDGLTDGFYTVHVDNIPATWLNASHLDATNEVQSGALTQGQELQAENLGGSADIQSGSLVISHDCLISDVDTTNEIQSASITQDAPLAEYAHDFSGSTIGAFQVVRAGTTSVLDYQAASQTIPIDTPAFEGGRWDGAWHDETVGYGVLTEVGSSCESTFSALSLPAQGVTRDYSGHIVYTLHGGTAGQGSSAHLLQITNATGNGANETRIVLDAGDVVGLYHFSGGTPTMEMQSHGVIADLAQLDVRFRVSSTTGLHVWVNGVKSSGSAAIADHIAPVDEVYIGVNITGSNATVGTCSLFRLVTAAVDDSTIEGWANWTPPSPVITMQPANLEVTES